MAGTKKQKMNISKAIVEAIYSMDPPGRFLKQCPDTGQWSELSRRDAADKAAQAMGYAMRGKDELKRKRDERRRSLRSSKKSNDDDGGGGGVVAAAASSQRADRPTTQQLHLHSSKNHLVGSASSSSSAPRHQPAARGSAAGDTNNKTESSASKNDCPDSSADEMPLPSVNQSSTATRPTSSTNQNVNQNGLAEVLAQAVQQQRLHHEQQQQQQLLQNPLGQLLHTQNPLQPAPLEGVNHQLLAQAQLRQLIQQQQQYHVQQLILLQHLLNQQSALPSESIATSLSSAPRGVLPIPNVASSYSSTPQSEPAASADVLHNLQQQLTNPSSNALLLSSMLNDLQNQPNNNMGILSAPEGAQQLDQLQRSLMLQQNNQLLASYPTASNQSFNLQHQLGPLHQAFQTAQLRQIQNSQDLPSTNAQPSSANANAAPSSTRQEERVDEDESVV